MAGACGTCTMCCRLLAIKELKKPGGKWCEHCNIGVGCKVYEQRPDSCRAFACIWLQSQDRQGNERMPLELRPDKSKVVMAMSMDNENVAVYCDPGHHTAWQYGPIGNVLAQFAKQIKVVVNNGKGHFYQIMSNSRAKEVIMSAPDENGAQWFERYK